MCHYPPGLWTAEKDVQAAQQGAGGGGLAALEQKLIRLLISKTNEVRSPFLLPCSTGAFPYNLRFRNHA